MQNLTALRRFRFVRTWTALSLATAMSLHSPSAEACGGLFCDANPDPAAIQPPITQAAERILFARDGATMHMLVMLTYAGDPIDFGWLVPVPDDVQTLVGDADVFAQLDALLTPRFRTTVEVDPICDDLADKFSNAGSEDDFIGGGGEGGGNDEGGDETPVQVLSREDVGPYDQVVLRADSVDDLRTWLTDNGYQFPAGAEPLVQSYIDLGLAFLALKLQASATAADVAPLHLMFTSDTPAIPLRLTSVAASPDMGILIHVLGPSRAVPINYPHVLINEAAIDWVRGGANYVDVVSQAIDEAGGRGFVTESANLRNPIYAEMPTEPTMAGVRAATLVSHLNASRLDLENPVIRRAVAQHAMLPEGRTAADWLWCAGCRGRWSTVPVDGPGLAESLEQGIIAWARTINRLVQESRYMTRLFTTMSSHEMTEDPIFAFNPDLPDVSNLHEAVRHVSCDENGLIDYTGAVIELDDGRTAATGNAAPPFIRRQNGETIRGQGTIAAALIQRMFASGQPETIEDRRRALKARPQPKIPRRPQAEGCDCNQGNSPAPTSALTGLLALLSLRRRRRQA